ncbi:hypothetical protein [Pedobacter sp. CFBP9032]|uniref:hypothetical protein n=1 Tax=Pedobacter sp. CFBP9032 TaxID=3096539 RepID=UPI002A6A2DD7|nr:hypothetical protein [Pedobacter sp. CFBP9032]MDY0906170.1 hypothetical protein [Pedobacter sp. CFBP9032]
MKKSFTIILLIGLTFLNFSCKKIATNETLSYDSGSKVMNASLSSLLLSGTPSYPLDWENISFMPSPPNAAIVPVPWQSGLGGIKIDQDMIYDYAKSDGWELVYNTFTTSAVLNPSYFMLYNKYRGVLRSYFYFAPGQNYPANNIVCGLSINGPGAAASPALNFSGSDITDYNTNQAAVTQLQPYQVSATGSWYAAEFEIAYDRTTATTAYPTTTMQWQINPNSIARITLNGTQGGELNGTIAVPSSKTNFFGALTNTFVNTALSLGGSSVARGIGGFLKEKETTVAGAVSNGLGGTISGFLNGIFGFTKRTTTNQKVSLTLNTSILVNGSSEVSSQIFDNTFAIPGTLNNNQAATFYPAYNIPMGVFYIDGKPKVLEKHTDTRVILPVPPIGEPDPRNGRKEGYNSFDTYTIDKNSFNLIFNPAVLSDATISNIRYEILAFEIEKILEIPKLPYSYEVSSSKKEDILSHGLVASDPLSIGIGFMSLVPNKSIAKPSAFGVRVSFDVVPKDGSPKQTIIKTFKANVAVI